LAISPKSPAIPHIPLNSTCASRPLVPPNQKNFAFGPFATTSRYIQPEPLNDDYLAEDKCTSNRKILMRPIDLGILMFPYASHLEDQSPIAPDAELFRPLE
jgi:hypothetical protein